MCGHYFFCCEKLLEPFRNFKKILGLVISLIFFPPTFEVLIRRLFVKFIIFSEWSSLTFYNVLSLPNNVISNIKIIIDITWSCILWKTRPLLKYMNVLLNNYVATPCQVFFTTFMYTSRVLNFSMIILKCWSFLKQLRSIF